MPTSKPKITIIIPHFRRLNFTLQALKSIKAQQGIEEEAIRIIVCDEEYSRETKRQLMKVCPKVSYLRNRHREGPGGNRQTGLDKVTSKYVLFLDSDDQLKPNYLEDMLAVLESNPKVVGVTCMSHPQFEAGFDFKHRLKLLPLTVIRDISLFATIFNRSQLFSAAFYLCQLSHIIFRTQSLKRFKFNYDYRRGGEDWDLISQAVLQGPILVLRRQLLIFRYSPGSSTENLVNQRLKWQSYRLLVSRLPSPLKQGIYYQLLLRYIKHFGS